ncbi:MAG TPA: hypothetical protein VGH19_12780 [Verrucomicrobiae bacterium]
MFSLHTINKKTVLAVGASAVLLVVWAVRSVLDKTLVTTERTVAQEMVKEMDSAAMTIRPRRSGEFFAAQKEKHIERLLKGIMAELPERDELKRSEYFVRKVEELAEEDAPSILQRLDDQLRHSEFGTLLLRRWAASSPEAAALWVLGLPEGAEREELLIQAAIVWGGQDHKAASEWAGGLAEGVEKQKVLQVVVEETIRQDAPAALALLGALAPSFEREQLAVRALNEWATQEPVAALQWVATLSTQSEQQIYKAGMVPVIASIDGASGARLVTSWFSPGQEQQWMAVSVVQRWAQQSPEATAEWVMKFPEGAMRVAALDNLKRITDLKISEDVQTADISTPP